MANTLTKDHHLWTRDTVKNVSGDVTLDIVGDLTLDAGGGDVNVLQADLTIPVDKKVIFGNTGEYIVGDNTNLNIVSSGNVDFSSTGHVEFDRCGVGFGKETTPFAQATVTSEGDDSTDIDFRLGNKHELTLTDDIAGSGEYINMIFPATSGNFILVLIQGVADCTVANGGWRAYASDATLCDNLAGTNGTDGNVRWAGGSAPTLSTSQYDIDIVSIYWDADNQTAFAVASLDF